MSASPYPRGDLRRRPLTAYEHSVLYYRAMTGSRKEAAACLNVSEESVKHAMTNAFNKLGVEDITEAYWVMGWLNPLPYGVRLAEVTHERLEHAEAS